MEVLLRRMPDVVAVYEVVGCRRGAEALALLEQRQVAILLTDRKLPYGASGLKLIKVIKARSPHIIVMLIEEAGLEEVEKAYPITTENLEVGVDYRIRLPYWEHDLAATIAGVPLTGSA